MKPEARDSTIAFYESYTRENPDASISDVLKAANRQSGVLVIQKLAIEYRKKVRRELEEKKKVETMSQTVSPKSKSDVPWTQRQLKPKDPPKVEYVPPLLPKPSAPTPTPSPASQPEFTMPIPSEPVQPPAAPAASPEAPPAAFLHSTAEERQAYVRRALEADPSLHPQIIQGQLRKTFGSAVGNDFIYTMCREARAKRGLEQLPTRVGTAWGPKEGTQEAVEGLVRDIIHLVRESGLPFNDFTFSIGESGKAEYSCEFKSTLSGKVDV